MSQYATLYGHSNIGQSTFDGYLQNPLQDDIAANNYSINNALNVNAVNLGAINTNSKFIQIPLEKPLPAAGQPSITFLDISGTVGTNRWGLGCFNTETHTGNGGQDLGLWSYNDTGGFITTVLSATRSSGHVTIPNNLTVLQNLTVNGSIDISGSITSSSAIVSTLPCANMQVSGAGGIVYVDAGSVNSNLFFQCSPGGLTVNLPATTGLPVGTWIRVANYFTSSGTLSVVVPGGNTTAVAADCSMLYCVIAGNTGGTLAVWARLTA